MNIVHTKSIVMFRRQAYLQLLISSRPLLFNIFFLHPGHIFRYNFVSCLLQHKMSVVHIKRKITDVCPFIPQQCEVCEFQVKYKMCLYTLLSRIICLFFVYYVEMLRQKLVHQFIFNLSAIIKYGIRLNLVTQCLKKAPGCGVETVECVGVRPGWQRPIGSGHRTPQGEPALWAGPRILAR